MNFVEIVELVNSDLENEWKHLTFYLKSSAVIRGVHRNHLSPFLFQQAQSELEHVLAFSKQVVALGGSPVTASTRELLIPFYAEEIIDNAIVLEQEVVITYTKRKRDLEALLDNYDSKESAKIQNLILFYEEQIEDSHTDLNELREMARGY